MALLAAAGARVEGETARLPGVPRRGRAGDRPRLLRAVRPVGRAGGPLRRRRRPVRPGVVRRQRPGPRDAATTVRPPRTTSSASSASRRCCRRTPPSPRPIVCTDVPAEIGDLYRLFLVLLDSDKPIVTGAFSPLGTAAMIDLLALDAGGRDALAARPRAVFDVCPSPPLTWTAFGGPQPRRPCPGPRPRRDGVDAARRRRGAGHARRVRRPARRRMPVRESPSTSWPGPGAPIVWGGAPAIVDMRTGVDPDGRHRDGHARRRLRAGRQGPQPADPRLPLGDRRQGDRRTRPAWRAG